MLGRQEGQLASQLLVQHHPSNLHATAPLLLRACSAPLHLQQRKILVLARWMLTATFNGRIFGMWLFRRLQAKAICSPGSNECGGQHHPAACSDHQCMHQYPPSSSWVKLILNSTHCKTRQRAPSELMPLSINLTTLGVRSFLVRIRARHSFSKRSLYSLGIFFTAYAAFVSSSKYLKQKSESATGSNELLLQFGWLRWLPFYTTETAPHSEFAAEMVYVGQVTFFLREDLHVDVGWSTCRRTKAE